MWRVGNGYGGCGNAMCECGGIGHQMWHAIEPCMVKFSFVETSSALNVAGIVLVDAVISLFGLPTVSTFVCICCEDIDKRN